ncbi:NAD(P)/FAD-dependent oxidoreductase [Microbacterium sp. NPDC089698]|uniref:NAD(P)/FAD-dependent oxidoreductase n=1 Tax=Microbacterium sp. NPDC089698 TaxID=3364200 RepID=UPI003804CAD1
MTTGTDNSAHVEIAVVGGGSAGLAAALNLVRARRSVVVIDNGEPRNSFADGAHGLLGLEGVNPLELLRTGRGEVRSYGARVVDGRVVEAYADENGFRVVTDAGDRLHARQLVIATGTRDLLPEIPGLADRWGRDAIHCPYCHGWEIRDQRIALLATGPMSALQAMMFRQWTDDVTFLPQGLEFPDADHAKLAAANITVDTRTVIGLDVVADRLAGVRFADGTTMPLDVLVVPTFTRARLDGLEGLGLTTSESPMGTAVVVDASGHTNVPGVWAAGNVAHPATQVSEAAANGTRVAITLNTELIFHDTEQKLPGTENNR